MGMAAGVPAKRPRGYEVHARSRAMLSAPAPAAPAPAAAQVGLVTFRGVLEQRASIWDCGETCGYDTIEQDICEALADPGVAGVVVAGDSPGGDDPGLGEACRRIRAFADLMQKPLLGYVDELAASAAVYLLVGICDAIYLPPSGRMGSISSCVIFQTAARALEKEGIDTYIARGLPGKYRPNDLEPLDALGKARLDAQALEGSERFIAFVSARRGIDPEIIRGWNVAMFTGAAAVDAGLADGVGSLEDVITLAAELAAIPRSEAA